MDFITQRHEERIQLFCLLVTLVAFQAVYAHYQLKLSSFNQLRNSNIKLTLSKSF